jgi:hypothetical protein
VEVEPLVNLILQEPVDLVVVEMLIRVILQLQQLEQQILEVVVEA